MKKNNRGFTLVELLAVIVILGILSVFALPLISRTINSSRNKMYVEDAKRFISQAEYILGSNSSMIEKPNAGDCIVISLSYMNTSTIRKGPHDGEYDVNNSFVVVKAVPNDELDSSIEYKYAVALIEHLKDGGYLGIPLTEEDSISIDKVTSFKSSQLMMVEGVTKDYINQQLSKSGTSYLTTGSIQKIYHQQEIRDSSIIEIESSPVIKSINIFSKDNNNMGSLEAVLSLTAMDADTERSKLKVFVSLIDFDASDQIEYSYGNYNSFTLDINFDGYLGHHYGYSEGAEITLYITVKDPDDHYVRQQLDYTVHVNVPPTIDSASLVTKDGVDFYKAKGTLSVFDDMDDLSSLKICFLPSQSGTCSNYQKFTDVVTNSVFDYTFTCSGKCRRDGSTHYLQVFVVDSSAKEVTSLPEPLTYVFPINKAPTITSATVTSISDQFPPTGNKKVVVQLNATDDLPVTRLQVHISADGTSEKVYPYTNDGSYEFTINGEYDGSVKNVRVFVTDEDDASSAIKEIPYTLYKNQAPQIIDFSVESLELKCANEDLCDEDEGSLFTKVSFEVVDDFDSQEQLQICVTEDQDNCNSFIPYNDFDGFYTVSGTYDGSTKLIRLFVKDQNQAVGIEKVDYQVYQNKIPNSIEVPSIQAAKNSYQIPLLDVYYYANVKDDLDDTLTYQICYQFDEGDVTCGNSMVSTTGVFHLNRDFFVNAPTEYLGKILTIYAKVKDSYQAEAFTTASVTYLLFEDEEPEILSADILLDGDNSADIYFSVKDYMDQYQIGISKTDSCENTTYFNTLYDGNNLVTNKISYTYEGELGDTIVCIKDTKGNVQEKTLTPTLKDDYVSCSVVDTATGKYEYVVAENQEGITRERCNSMCYAFNPITNEENEVEGFYRRKLTYFDKFNSTISCLAKDEEYIANCSFKDCFLKNNQYLRAIGIVLYKAPAVWTMQYDGVTYSSSYYYKVYESSYHTGDSMITLTEIEGERVHPSLVLNENYMSQYVRIVD